MAVLEQGAMSAFAIAAENVSISSATAPTTASPAGAATEPLASLEATGIALT
jgi:hypothetical protein